MKEKPSSHETHLEAALRRSDVHRAAREREREQGRAQVLAEERWQRRLLPLLASVREVPSDFPGCQW